MATSYIQQAESQINPVYQQQTATLQAQIPAIQNLYQTLTQGLQGQYESNLKSGVQSIAEDASARGVLRSTLPVDARQDLTGQLGAALQQSLGNLGLQQTKEVGAVQQQIGQLGIDRLSAIQRLAGTLQETDLRERDFQMRQQQAQFEQNLAMQKLAAERAAVQQGAPTGLIKGISQLFSSKQGRDKFVSPETFREGMRQWVEAGGAPASFLDTFGGYVNPVHQQQFGGYY